MARRLNAGIRVPPGVAGPGYVPEAHGTGIVHVGIGAFHRAHQAVYTDDALAAAGGDWRILGVSLRSTRVAEALNPQDGRFSVTEMAPGEPRVRVIGSVARVIAADAEATLRALADPAIRVAMLTVTEAGYGIDRATRAPDPAHPAVAADLASPRRPEGVLGLLVEALRRRRVSGAGGLTILSCDNLPGNGALLCDGTRAFAAGVAPDLAGWIAEHVAFPSSMVDRITPAPAPEVFAAAEAALGCRDLGAVAAEPFRQWVIEDRFATARPAWEAGGAEFVRDVEPFERMKLTMLNGAHSFIAYAGGLLGLRHVRDAMALPGLAARIDAQMRAAAAVVGPIEADLDAYRRAVLARFANPAIVHETAQIAIDGTGKLPQRIIAPWRAARAQGGRTGPFALALGCWMAWCARSIARGEMPADPRHDAIAAGVRAGAWAEKARALGGLVGADAPMADAAAAMARQLTDPAAARRLLAGG